MGRRKPTAIDLFSGCGGLTHGLRDAGFRVLAGVENDALAVATFRANHRGVKVWECDICDLQPCDLLSHHRLEKGQLDLLAGCPPCQGFSALRRLNGGRRNRDNRKDLVFEFMRFVGGLYPKVIMMENVPRLMKDRRMTAIRNRLHKLGYEGRPAVLDAADYGVPQRRRRMIYIASRIGMIQYAAPDAEGDRRTVRDAIQDIALPAESDDPLHMINERRSERVREMISLIPKDGGSRRALGEDKQLRCHQKCDGFKDIYGRMAWNDVSPTITGGCVNPSKGRFLHPTQNRAITLREAALLQSFPEDYTFSTERGKFAVAQLIGNAFPPEFARRHARLIALALSENK